MPPEGHDYYPIIGGIRTGKSTYKPVPAIAPPIMMLPNDSIEATKMSPLEEHEMALQFLLVDINTQIERQVNFYNTYIDAKSTMRLMLNKKLSIHDSPFINQSATTILNFFVKS